MQLEECICNMKKTRAANEGTVGTGSLPLNMFNVRAIELGTDTITFTHTKYSCICLNFFVR